MKLVIQGVLALVAITLAWLIYSSINNKIEFQKITENRKSVVVERLKDIRTVQACYKSVNGVYAKDFNTLISFVKEDSLPFIKAIGTVPDTLTEQQAVEMGIVIRDTFKIPIRDTLFHAGYPIDSIQFIPYSKNETFDLDAGMIEKNKLRVQVFEAFADYNKILTGLKTDNEGIDLSDGLRVGSMTEPTTTGNWE